MLINGPLRCKRPSHPFGSSMAELRSVNPRVQVRLLAEGLLKGCSEIPGYFVANQVRILDGVRTINTHITFLILQI